MSSRTKRWATAALAALACTVIIGSVSSAQSNKELSPKQQKLKAAGTNVTLAIFPVRVLERPDRNVADALGLVLEKAGMGKLDVSTSTFESDKGSNWQQTTHKLSEHIKQNPLKADYALYSEFLGTPRTGPTEVRWLIADASGEIVLSDVQKPDDSDFQRTAGRDRDPLGCASLVSERVFKLTGWTKGKSTSAGDGKFARLWAEKSGTPSGAEIVAMKDRAAKLKQVLRKSKVGVLASRVGILEDRESGKRIADMLHKKYGCEAALLEADAKFTIKPTSNQQKRLWDLARAARSYLQKEDQKVDYVVFAEFLMNEEKQVAHTVHFFVLDRKGEWVIVDFQNDQHPDFKAIDPKSIPECESLVMKRLERRL